MNKDMLLKLGDLMKEGLEVKKDLLILFKQKMQNLFLKIKEFGSFAGDEREITTEVINSLETILRVRKLDNLSQIEEYGRPIKDYLEKYFSPEYSIQSPQYRILVSWLITHKLGKIKTELNYEQYSSAWLDEWLLGKIIRETFQKIGCNEEVAKREVLILKILTASNFTLNFINLYKIKEMLEDYKVQEYLNFNWYAGILWLNKEALEELIYWLLTTSIINTAYESIDEEELLSNIANQYKTGRKILQVAEESQYQVKEILERLALLNLPN
jgi:hypothetical protein